jgi:hypothetical protein
MIRVFWTPKTNTQRSALARFGTDWQIHWATPRPSSVRRQKCWFIHPVGNPAEARWVPVEQVKIDAAVRRIDHWATGAS